MLKYLPPHITEDKYSEVFEDYSNIVDARKRIAEFKK